MLYDLSPPVSPQLAVWPGDTVAEREVLTEIDDGDNIRLSTLRSTVHLGSHADAPSHFSADGASIDQVDLAPYVGPAQVMRISVAPGATIGPSDLTVGISAPRLLIDTGTFADPNTWTDTFAALTPELVDHLADHSVVLVGLDSPSVDLADSKDLPTHQRLAARNMRNLEGLVLAGVPEGIYELLALPLPLVGFDGSPVRAVLRTL